jgi:cation transport protein ChaC
VLALDPKPGATVAGLALRVADGHEDGALQYLRERELVSSAYLETSVRLALEDGRAVDALAFVVDTAHRQYCSGLPLEEQARIIASAMGGRGPNTEYLWNTVSHLHELGIPDADLDWLAHRVRELAA